MASILMGNLPAFGHLNPTLPLVAELAHCGHSVDYLSTEHFRGPIEASGATVIPIDSPTWFDPRDGRSVIRAIPRLTHSLNRALRQLGPHHDLLAVGGMDPVVPDLERELNVPVVYLSAVFLQNARTLDHMLRICRDLPAAAGFLMRHRTLTKALSPIVSHTLMGTRVPDLLDMFGPQSSTLNVVFTSRDFQPFAGDFDDTCLFVGPTPTRSLPDPTFPLDRLRDHNGTVVYATLGTVYNRWTHFFRAVVDAFEGPDTLVVIAAGHPDRVREIGAVPDNVILRPFVPQADVLANADLAIAHGGMGTVSDAVTYGVPLILTPLAADQFFNAYRLEELGIGQVVSKGRFDSAAVREAATSVLADHGGRAGMTRLQNSFATAGGAEAAARAITAILTSQHRGSEDPCDGQFRTCSGDAAASVARRVAHPHPPVRRTRDRRVS